MRWRTIKATLGKRRRQAEPPRSLRENVLAITRVEIRHIEDEGVWAASGKFPDGSIYCGGGRDGSLESSKAKAEVVAREVFGADVLIEHITDPDET